MHQFPEKRDRRKMRAIQIKWCPIDSKKYLGILRILVRKISRPNRKKHGSFAHPLSGSVQTFYYTACRTIVNDREALILRNCETRRRYVVFLFFTRRSRAADCPDATIRMIYNNSYLTQLTGMDYPLPWTMLFFPFKFYHLNGRLGLINGRGI